MPRITGLLSLLITLTILLTGCWDRTELDELAITSASSLDFDQGRWILSYQVIIPSIISSGTEGAKRSASIVPVVVHSTEGATIQEAFSKSYLETPRKLYFGHNSVLVIGEKAAQQGLDQISDVYFRNSSTRETVSLLVTPGKGRTILEQLINMNPIPGQGIQSILENEEKNLSMLPNMKLYELSRQMLSPSQTAILPEIIIAGKGEVTSVDQLAKTTVPSKLKLGRAAIIKKDKLVGWLSEKEALGVSFLTNSINSSTIPFPSQVKNAEPDSSFVLTTSGTKLTMKEKDGRFLFTAAIKVKGRINETNGSLDLIKPDTIKTMEDHVAAEIRKIVLQSWTAMKKQQADAAGFTDLLYRKQPGQWRQMAEENIPVLEKSDLEVQVKVRIGKVGLSNKGYNMLKNP